eukprot:TRINITY_DN7878_c0_g1_i10.p1 TRINITY_DN7878_c0_g1~~TRINITY_DN7878_c0_g1_i10.p1  ORF type:complete len:253 (+),score=51.89 TRINITY_DN7878_c0_g1_i10:93-851(+)
MNLWSVVATVHAPANVSVPSGKELLITRAALASPETGPNILSFQRELSEPEIVLGTLRYGGCEQFKIDLCLAPTSTLTLLVKGNGEVHLSGYYQPTKVYDTGNSNFQASISRGVNSETELTKEDLLDQDGTGSEDSFGEDEVSSDEEETETFQDKSKMKSGQQKNVSQQIPQSKIKDQQPKQTKVETKPKNVPTKNTEEVHNKPSNKRGRENKKETPTKKAKSGKESIACELCGKQFCSENGVVAHKAAMHK